MEDASILGNDATADAGSYFDLDDRTLVLGQHCRVPQRANIGVILHADGASECVLHMLQSVERVPAGHNRWSYRRILMDVNTGGKRQYGVTQRQVGVRLRSQAPQTVADPAQQFVRGVVGYRNHMPFVRKQAHVHVGDGEHGVSGAHIGHGDQSESVVDHQAFRGAPTIRRNLPGDRQYLSVQQSVHARRHRRSGQAGFTNQLSLAVRLAGSDQQRDLTW